MAMPTLHPVYHREIIQVMKTQRDSIGFLMALCADFENVNRFWRIEGETLGDTIPQEVLGIPEERWADAFKIWRSSDVVEDKKLDFKDLWFICTRIIPHIENAQDAEFFCSAFRRMAEASSIVRRDGLFDMLRQKPNLLPNLLKLKDIVDLKSFWGIRNIEEMFTSHGFLSLGDLFKPFADHQKRWSFLYQDRYLLNLVPYNVLMRMKLGEIPADAQERLFIFDGKDDYEFHSFMSKRWIQNTWVRNSKNPNVRILLDLFSENLYHPSELQSGVFIIDAEVRMMVDIAEEFFFGDLLIYKKKLSFFHHFLYCREEANSLIKEMVLNTEKWKDKKSQPRLRCMEYDRLLNSMPDKDKETLCQHLKNKDWHLAEKQLKQYAMKKEIPSCS